MRPARTPIRRVCAVALTAVLAAALSLTGAPAQAVEPMVIHGTVTGPGGLVLTNASVEIFGPNGSTGFGADPTGHYEFGPVPAGSYFVRASGNAEHAPQFYSNAATIEEATPIVVTEGAVVPPVDIQLAVGGRIEGQLTGPGGVAVPNLVVQVYRHNLASATEEWQIIGAGFANATSGAYAIGGLPDGDYRVHFNDQSHPRKYLNEIYVDNVQTLVTVSGAGTVTGIDGELTEGGHITGKITGGGNGLSARATAYDATTGHQVAQANSDSQGNYDLRGLPTGSYKVEFQPNGGDYLSEFHLDALDLAGATPIDVTVSETVALGETALAPASKITGTVLGSDGLPLEEVRVTNIEVIGGVAEDPGGGYHAETDADGVFTVKGLRAGTYRLAFEKPDSEYSREFFPDQDSVEAGANIEVDPDETVDVGETTLDLAGTIRGQLTSPAGADPRVILHRRYGAEWRMLDTWSVDPAGMFEMLQLRAGTFRVEFKDLVSGTSRYWNGAKTFESATDLSLAPGGEATITGSLIDPVVTPPPSPSPSATPSESPSPTPSMAPTIAPVPVLKTVAATKLPVIKGKPVVGRTLKVTAGSWNAPGVTRVHQWLANGKKIKKATRARLSMTRKLVGKKISVRIVVSAPGYLPGTVTIRRAGRVQGL